MNKSTYLHIGKFTVYGWKATAILIGIMYGLGLVCVAILFAMEGLL